MCWTPSVGGDGVTTRRCALSKRPCSPARRSAGVARRHVVAHSLLFTWRRQACQERLGGDAAPALVPVEIAPVAAPISSGAPQLASSPPAQRRAGIMEIELGGGCRVRVDRDVDVEALQQVLELLRRR
ncbi:IS66-like element accessory protein TnpA [Bradyrhizobium vignae]|uniref:IS66-like element accessory protein TnpA n=1 Tax=Bradyrhizobium vignae TaxID=1549949 RepID=UPI0040628914